MPRINTERYRIPSQSDLAAFAALVFDLQDRDLAAADKLVLQFHYSLTHFEDLGDGGDTSFLLQEVKPIEKGWGLYAFRLAPINNIIVEAPHPLADQTTDHVALDIYRTLKARALLVAGAHRQANRDGSADVAHAPESIFESVHEGLLRQYRTTVGQPIVLQVHGFAGRKHAGYPAVVLGIGRRPSATQAALANRLISGLTSRGVLAAACTDELYEDICGTNNVQAASAGDGTFIHIELDESIRNSDQTLLSALEAAIQ
jgi:hypothetical protein